MADIVFSGSREGMNRKQQDALDERLWAMGGHYMLGNPHTLHHGMSGESDLIAHQTARKWDYYIIGHPCNIEKYRIDVDVDEIREVKEPLVRNQDMIDEAGPSSGRCIITPNTDKPLAHPSGTWSTGIRAIKTGLLLEIIQLNGKIRFEI